MEENGIAIAVVAVCLCAIAAGTVSRRIQGTIITLPMIYVALGLALSPAGLDLINLNLGSELVRIVAELTLVLVLATDATRIRLRSLVRYHTIPALLLGIGLPLMMIFGAFVAALIFDGFYLWQAALLSIVLAPTDAGLGQAVVVNRAVPVRIRQALNIESGLNDGLAMPFLLLTLGLAATTERVFGLTDWVQLAVYSLIVGVLVGLAVGYLGARLVAWGTSIRWMTIGFQKVSGLLLAILTYALAESMGGNGFIAAFCMGMIAGNVYPEKVKEIMREFTEVEVEILMALTFMIIFGATMLPLALGTFDTRMLIYALLSLVVIRPLSVAISLATVKLRPLTVGFLGWFGPRGIATILYVFITMEADLVDVGTIYGAAMLTVLISVYAHGITAAPAAKWYASQIASQVDADADERMDVPEMPVRYRSHRPVEAEPAA